MIGVTERIRDLIERELPALVACLEEAECVLRDLESGIGVTPIDPERVATPGPRARRAANRAPLSPIPAARRTWDTFTLRQSWDPFRDELLAHIDRERAMVYPLALSILEGRMDRRRALATPISQMVAEHEALRMRVPSVRRAVMGHDAVSRQVQRVLVAFERHTKAEETELFPALLQLADGRFDVTATPLRARYQTSGEVARSLRKARPQKPVDESLLQRLRTWLKTRS